MSPQCLNNKIDFTVKLLLFSLQYLRSWCCSCCCAGHFIKKCSTSSSSWHTAQNGSDRWPIVCSFSPSLTWPRRSLVIWTSLWRGRSSLYMFWWLFVYSLSSVCVHSIFDFYVCVMRWCIIPLRLNNMLYIYRLDLDVGLSTTTWTNNTLYNTCHFQLSFYMYSGLKGMGNKVRASNIVKE